MLGGDKMNLEFIKYCPKCGSNRLTVEKEAGQYNVMCLRCNFYGEIFVFDEGDFEEWNHSE